MVAVGLIILVLFVYMIQKAVRNHEVTVRYVAECNRNFFPDIQDEQDLLLYRELLLEEHGIDTVNFCWRLLPPEIREWGSGLRKGGS